MNLVIEMITKSLKKRLFSMGLVSNFKREDLWTTRPEWRR